jgi:hypothetical protein
MTNLEKPIHRVTRGALTDFWGPDGGKRLVASLEVGDLLVLRPHGTRRPETVSLFDVYRYAFMARVNAGRLDKARAKKKAIAERKERRRLLRSTRKPATKATA